MGHRVSSLGQTWPVLTSKRITTNISGGSDAFTKIMRQFPRVQKHIDAILQEVRLREDMLFESIHDWYLGTAGCISHCKFQQNNVQLASAGPTPPQQVLW